MEAISGRKTIQVMTADYSIHSNLVIQLKCQLLDNGSELFTWGKQNMEKEERQANDAELLQQIARLQMELKWPKKIYVALIPVNCASLSITATLSSASAAIGTLLL